MFTHYIKIAFRNMWKHKTQSLIGIFGLAFGLACFVPALYWLRYETSYDSFYPEAERIYRVYTKEKQSGKVNENAPYFLSRRMIEQFPAVEAATSVYSEINICSTKEVPSIPLRTLQADSSFFSVFKLEFVSGETQAPLQVLFNMMLTESTAIRLFGDVEKAIGQQIQSTFYFFNDPYTVTAVVKDPPANTNMPFDALLYHDLLAGLSQTPEEYRWLDLSTHVHVKLYPGADVEALAEQVRGYPAEQNPMVIYDVELLPMSDVRHKLLSSAAFTLNFIQLFVAAGILLLFSAVFNFLNLYLDLFRQRLREWHLRAVHGASAGRLIRQMMLELGCAVLLALLLGYCFVGVSRPAFSGLLEIEMGMPEMSRLFGTCGMGLLVVILFAGGMLFWRLSRLAMRPLSETRASGQPVLQRMAVTLQLAVSVVFLVAAGVVMMQMRFVNHKDLGFDSRGIIQLNGLPPYMQGNIRTALLQALDGIPLIDHVSTSNFMPQHNANSLEMISVVEWPGKPPGEKPAFNVIPTDHRFAETFGLQMRMGAWIGEGKGEGRFGNQIVLNEEAARVMGLSDPIGTTVRIGLGNVEVEENIVTYEVVGVVNDFHTLSLRNRIQPTIFRPSFSVGGGRVVADNILYIHVAPGMEQEAIQQINAVLPDIDAMMAGVSLRPLGEVYDSFNQSEQAGLRLFSVLATVCLLISLFGIYAVAAAATLRRRKEIAIRKVVGAEAETIVSLFFREYMLQVILAGAVALPLGYLAMSRWLQGYAYRTNIPWWLLAGILVGVIAVVLLTVLGQVLKAANSNPAEVVKSE